MQTGFTQANLYPTDARGTLYYFVYSSVKHPGAGQYYLFVTRDRDGNQLDGAATYRLRVPPKPPVTQYWSAVLYDFDTHALFRFYGPEKPLFDKTWVLPDIEKV